MGESAIPYEFWRTENFLERLKILQLHDIAFES